MTASFPTSPVSTRPPHINQTHSIDVLTIHPLQPTNSVLQDTDLQDTDMQNTPLFSDSLHDRFRLLALTVLLLGISSSTCFAQGDSWEQKKKQRFRALTETEKQAIEEAIPEKPRVQPRSPRRLLVFYRCEGFIHTSIPHANEAIRVMSTRPGTFEADFADTYDVFTKENLAKYDAILLNNTTHMKFPEPSHQNAFLDFIAEGNGLIGIHAASDNFGRHPECMAVIGGIFAGHPWGAGGRWAFKLDDPNHELNRVFDGKGFWHSDEIYQYNPKSFIGTEKLRVLVSLDMTKAAVSERINDGPREVPVSWVRSVGEGRLFYTNFGHREDTFQKSNIVQHMLDGIQFALGDLPADTTPTDQASTIGPPALAPDTK
jgi:type 1 glutamine amidotransferase